MEERRAHDTKVIDSTLEANRWCQKLGVPRTFTTRRRNGKFGVVVTDQLTVDVQKRVISTTMFMREHRKLEALMELKRVEDHANDKQVNAWTRPIPLERSSLRPMPVERNNVVQRSSITSLAAAPGIDVGHVGPVLIWERVRSYRFVVPDFQIS